MPMRDQSAVQLIKKRIANLRAKQEECRRQAQEIEARLNELIALCKDIAEAGEAPAAPEVNSSLPPAAHPAAPTVSTAPTLEDPVLLDLEARILHHVAARPKGIKKDDLLQFLSEEVHTEPSALRRLVLTALRRLQDSGQVMQNHMGKVFPVARRLTPVEGEEGDVSRAADFTAMANRVNEEGRA